MRPMTVPERATRAIVYGRRMVDGTLKLEVPTLPALARLAAPRNETRATALVTLFIRCSLLLSGGLEVRLVPLAIRVRHWDAFFQQSKERTMRFRTKAN